MASKQRWVMGERNLFEHACAGEYEIDEGSHNDLFYCCAQISNLALAWRRSGLQHEMTFSEFVQALGHVKKHSGDLYIDSLN